MLILKPITIAACAGAALLLLRRGPFPTWQKALFLAGAYPFYEYAVICRPFGIGMLLLFAVAALFPRRFTRPLPLRVPKTGRYIESDPLGLLSGTNPFAYASSRPVTNVDPLGLADSSCNTGSELEAVCGPEPVTGLSRREMLFVAKYVDMVSSVTAGLDRNDAGRLAVGLVRSKGPLDFKSDYRRGTQKYERKRLFGNVTAGAIGTGALDYPPYVLENVAGAYSLYLNNMFRIGPMPIMLKDFRFAGWPLLMPPYGDLDQDSGATVARGAEWGAWYRCVKAHQGNP